MFVDRAYRVQLLACVVALVTAAAGCSPPPPPPLEDTGPDSMPDSGDAPSDGTSAGETIAEDVSDASDSTTDGVGEDADAADVADDGVDASSDGAVEAETAISMTCGDGIRDPASEECDDGPTDGGDLRATCSSTCGVRDVVALITGADAGPPSSGRLLGHGRHPLAVNDGGFAVAFLEQSTAARRLLLTTFDQKKASDVATVVTSAPTLALAANPVVASLPSGKVAVAWNDVGADGDGLGVALRLVTPGTTPSGALSFANESRSYGQFDPDVIWTGTEVIVAWVDAASVARGYDLKYRRFDASLTPITAELDLAVTLDAESDPALARFGTGWAIAYRAARGGLETIVATSGADTWTVGPRLPGPSAARPAIAELDATHLAVAFISGRETGDASVPGGYELRLAVATVGAPGAVSSIVATTATSPREVNLVRVGARTYLAWRAEAIVADPKGEELWLREIRLVDGALDMTGTELAVPRHDGHRAEDQRFVGLAGNTGALVVVWNDYAKTVTGATFSPEIVVERIPVPILRLGDGGL